MYPISATKSGISGAVLVLLLYSIPLYSQVEWKRFSFTESKMGSPLSLVIYEQNAGRAQATAVDAYALVDSLVEIYSDYIDSSELNKLSRSSGTGKWVRVSPALFDILLTARKAYRMSEGSFDITTGPLVKRWRIARREKALPNSSELVELQKKTGFNKIRIRRCRKQVKLTAPGMQLDLGGIAQGYIADKVLQRIRDRGAFAALVDVSGDIVVFGIPPGREGWVIGINVPEAIDEIAATVMLQKGSVSTSGDVYQFLEIDGRRYSHIVDPRTGYGLSNQRNVTIIARDALTADWLTTACSILPLEDAERLARKTNSEYLIGYLHDGLLKWVQSDGFHNYLEKMQVTPPGQL